MVILIDIVCYVKRLPVFYDKPLMNILISIYLFTWGIVSVYAQESDCSKRWQELFASTNKDLEGLLKGPLFLHKKNPTRHSEQEIMEIEAKLKAAGVKNPGAPERKLLAWLWEIEDEWKAIKKDPAKLQKLKEKLYAQYVIAEDAIPESYFDLQKRIAREQGYGDITITPEMRRQLAETLRNDQKRSLDRWVDYLMSDDTNHYPMWAKLWVFEDMVRLNKYHPETGKFSRRSNSTVAPFIGLNRGALGKVMDGITKKVAGKPLDKFDPELIKLLDKGKFSELYAAVLKNLGDKKVNLEITEGKWVKYPKGSSPDRLVQSLDSCTTGWCTEGESTATSQLKAGDFYVYYSNDELGNPEHPRIAIRMEGKEIKEVRGIAYEQNLDAEIAKTDILKNKLKEFGSEGEKYQKRSEHMQRLTLIEKKIQASEDLSMEDLRFLYEMDEIIEGFGYQRDPRIDEILNKRDTDSDLTMIFGKEKLTAVGDKINLKVATWLEHPDRVGTTVKTKSGAKFTRVKDKRFDHLGASWKDEDTGLIWSHGAGEKMNHADAIKFCKKLGGELPTKEILEALAGKKGQHLFSDNANSYLWWSSSVHPSYSSLAWMFNSNYGLVDDSNSFYKVSVRCVAR